MKEIIVNRYYRKEEIVDVGGTDGFRMKGPQDLRKVVRRIPILPDPIVERKMSFNNWVKKLTEKDIWEVIQSFSIEVDEWEREQFKQDPKYFFSRKHNKLVDKFLELYKEIDVRLPAGLEDFFYKIEIQEVEEAEGTERIERTGNVFIPLDVYEKLPKLSVYADGAWYDPKTGEKVSL